LSGPRYFLAKISLVDDNTEEAIEKLCTIFVENGKQDPEGSHSHSAQNKPGQPHVTGNNNQLQA
jgi:hypothetical protein